MPVPRVAAQYKSGGDSDQYDGPGAQWNPVVFLGLKKDGARHVQKDSDYEATHDDVDVRMLGNQ